MFGLPLWYIIACVPLAFLIRFVLKYGLRSRDLPRGEIGTEAIDFAGVEDAIERNRRAQARNNNWIRFPRRFR